MKIVDYTSEPRSVARLAERRLEPDPAVEARVREIMQSVRTEGDEALTTLTRQYDCRFIDSIGLRVSPGEIDHAYAAVSRAYTRSLRVAMAQVTRFHRRQVPRSFVVREKGMRLTQRFTPIARVGIYVPGGKASYPSTVIMNAVPARIAGVREIVMASPAGDDGRLPAEVLVAAAECGITEIYRIGGAQAIAALAYGTESIRPVDKITGPGNAYVAAAKRMVFGAVGIEMIAGPTEVVVVADRNARADYVAADLLAQAEHDELASPICIVASRAQAESVLSQVEIQLATARRGAIARKAFDGQGLAIIAPKKKDAAAIVNMLAPEHVELLVGDPRAYARLITNAGSVFLGRWSTEAFGDYAAGPNHTLPTAGSARFSSPLGVADFVKFSNLIEISRPAFLRLAPHVRELARSEGFEGHERSVAIREEKR
ncbi:MAG TPA: histidinol dehydrogenase [Bacteroidota bacterium]|nr:histidinol dehydrogenase [Bacteroidota bacterium]